MVPAIVATNRLLDVARAAGHPVAFTVISYDSAEQARASWPKVPAVAELLVGSTGVRVERRLARSPDDVVFTKKGPSAFYGTTVARWLADQGADTLVVSGATTSGCVRATVVDGMQLGFGILVVQEAVADRDAASQTASLRDIDQKYGDVVCLDEACSYLTEVRR